EAIMFGHEQIKKLIAFQEEIVAAVGKEKVEVALYTVDADLERQVREIAEGDMNRAVQVQEKHARENAIKEVKSAVAAKFEEQDVEEEVLN
nr:hypothetical protein [Escherichia coli]